MHGWIGDINFSPRHWSEPESHVHGEAKGTLGSQTEKRRAEKTLPAVCNCRQPIYSFKSVSVLSEKSFISSGDSFLYESIAR